MAFFFNSKKKKEIKQIIISESTDKYIELYSCNVVLHNHKKKKK